MKWNLDWWSVSFFTSFFIPAGTMFGEVNLYSSLGGLLLIIGFLLPASTLLYFLCHVKTVEDGKKVHSSSKALAFASILGGLVAQYIPYSWLVGIDSISCYVVLWGRVLFPGLFVVPLMLRLYLFTQLNYVESMKEKMMVGIPHLSFKYHILP